MNLDSHNSTTTKNWRRKQKMTVCGMRPWAVQYGRYRYTHWLDNGFTDDACSRPASPPCTWLHRKVTLRWFASFWAMEPTRVWLLRSGTSRFIVSPLVPFVCNCSLQCSGLAVMGYVTCIHDAVTAKLSLVSVCSVISRSFTNPGREGIWSL